jgi:HD-GYP domain-containing protein (c-di-GMP phosphodiesterase class II)
MREDKEDTNLLRREVARLSRLLQIGRALSSDIHLENLMDKVTHECALLVGASNCVIWIFDREQSELWTALFPSGRIVKLPLREGMVGWVATTREYIISDSPHLDSRFKGKLEEVFGLKVENILIIPLVNYRSETIGVIEMINKESGGFTNEDYLLLQAAGAQISMTIENARLYNDLRKTLGSLTEVMAATIDAKHPISKGHSHRVAKYSVGIAREMGLSERDIEQIRIASLLHDYGKIGIDDVILKKEGPLTESEYEQIKSHAKITHDIVSKVHFAEDLADVPLIASAHHERWDGRGYPFGMAREAIPLGARIIGVADSFDAITSAREYKKALTFEEAKCLILSESGSHFDPLVVDAFARYYNKILKPMLDRGEIPNGGL